jgi:hypothetical protein
MITIRQIERLFVNQQFRQLYRELMANRPETPRMSYQTGTAPSDCPKLPKIAQFSSVCELGLTLARVVPVAALGMIRMDELSQGSHPFYRRLLNVVLTSQQKDGGWGDPLTTALCLRALLGSNGEGNSIHGGLGYLATLQKTEGIWPKEPIRRLPADAFVSAFILHQLGEFAAFRNCVRFEDAILWFATHVKNLDEETQRLWSHARTRCRVNSNHTTTTLWSPKRPAA